MFFNSESELGLEAWSFVSHLFLGRGERAVDAGAQTVDEPRVESLGRSDHAALGMTTEVNVYPWLQGGAPQLYYIYISWFLIPINP